MKISNGVKKQSGSGLIFAVVLLFVILGMVITLSSITVLETKMSQKTKSSVGAFYNSESGVEWALNQISTKSGTIASAFSGKLNTSTGKVTCPDFGSGSDCAVYLLDSSGKIITSSTPNFSSLTLSDIKAVRSVGSQGTSGTADTQRAIEAAVASGGIGKYQTTCASYNDASASGNFCCITDTESSTTHCYLTTGKSGTWSVSWNELNF